MPCISPTSSVRQRKPWSWAWAAQGMRRGLAGMAVGMEMHRAVAMAMAVKMHPVAPQPPQHMGAEADQHQADSSLIEPGNGFGDDQAEQDGAACKDEQRQRVAKPQVRPCLTISATWLRRAAMLETAAI